MVRIAQHVERIMDPPIVEITSLLKNKETCISFGQGVPFFYPDSELITEFWREIKNNREAHVYSPDLGFPGIRKQLTQYLHPRYKADISWENVILTNGGNSAFFNILSGVLDPQDEVIIIAPYYFNHLMAVQLLHAIPVCLDTSWDSGFVPKAEVLANKITNKTKAIILVSPNNPTGAVYDNKAIDIILEICEERNLLLILDETYSEFIYENNKITKSYYHRNSERLIHIGSFSKNYGLSGWRIGYAVLPDFLLQAYLKVQDTTMISPPTISQLLIGFLLRNEIDLISQNMNTLIESRNSMLTRINDSELVEVQPTNGALYLFVKITPPLTGTEFAKNLASKCNIIVVPGNVFGKSYTKYVRFSYGSTSTNLIDNGFNLIDELMK
jgi:aspartate/methionine/tyrosine aminotransferase